MWTTAVFELVQRFYHDAEIGNVAQGLQTTACEAILSMMNK